LTRFLKIENDFKLLKILRKIIRIDKKDPNCANIFRSLKKLDLARKMRKTYTNIIENHQNILN
jgi:hypothetical protein